MFPMSVGRSQESTRNLTSVKHILLWYVSPFFFILFWALMCSAVSPVHRRLRPGSEVKGKCKKTEWYGIEKNWRTERRLRRGKGWLFAPQTIAGWFFLPFPPTAEPGHTLHFFFFTRIDLLSARNQWIHSPKRLSRLVYLRS